MEDSRIYQFLLLFSCWLLRSVISSRFFPHFVSAVSSLFAVVVLSPLFEKGDVSCIFSFGLCFNSNHSSFDCYHGEVCIIKITVKSWVTLVSFHDDFIAHDECYLLWFWVILWRPFIFLLLIVFDTFVKRRCLLLLLLLIVGDKVSNFTVEEKVDNQLLYME